MRDKIKGRRLFFISFLFFMLLNFPVVSIFNKGGYIGGVPVLYVYIMMVWLTGIGVTGLFVERQQTDKLNKD